MPTDEKKPQAVFTHRVLFLRLGELISQYHALRFPDPFEHPTPPTNDPAKLLASIHDETLKLKSLTAAHPAFEPLRKAVGIQAKTMLKPEVVQVISLVAYYDFIKGEQMVESITNCLAAILNADLIEGKLHARVVMAALIERGILVVRENLIHVNEPLASWLSGGHPLCHPRLVEDTVRAYCRSKRAREQAEVAPQVQPSSPVQPSINSPRELYERLTAIVKGQNSACRALATHGWLHLKRAELLKQGQKVGSNECLFFISEQSGVGKTYLAENYGKLCGLPFTSFSSTDATGVGYVGLDLVDDSIKNLIRAAGNPQERSTIEKAQQGIIFYDEFTKKRTSFTADGRDVSGLSVQHEILRVMEGCKVLIGARKAERENSGIEVDTSGMMLLFGGFVDGFDKIIAKLSRKQSGLGFGGGRELMARDAYLYDALVDHGMIREFVNRLTKIIMFRKLTAADLEEIADSPTGIIANFNEQLSPLGLTIRIEPRGVRWMAQFAVDTALMVRGMKMVISELIEDAVFCGSKGDVLFSFNNVVEAIESTRCG